MSYLQVSITSPKKELFTGEASSVSSTNSVGKFDILPEHANFVTLIEKQPIIIRPPKGKQVVFNFSLAVISVNSNKVSIYTDIQPMISSS
ncbi:MAG: hypothetical protein Q7R43_01410 [Candidatus Daviesbacteria bacterium]|nr:hypothetical protein [Candidatus Daviesbacteria bacterium]